MTRTHGFTRTETTVVLGGAAILAATIFPLAVRAQNAAQMPDPMATCQSNLKQVGLGILQYVQDYDEKMPMATYANGRTSWRSALQPYVKSTVIMACPSNPNHRQQMREDRQIEIPISYAINGVVAWRGGSMTLSQIKSPAELLLVGESVRGDAMMPMPLSTNEFARGRALFAGHFQMADFLRWRNAEHNAPNATADENAPPAISAMTNVLFGDGHVNAMRPTQTLPNWYNAPVNQRTANDLARRLYAAEAFYANWLLDAAEATEGNAAPRDAAPAEQKAPREKPAN